VVEAEPVVEKIVSGGVVDAAVVETLVSAGFEPTILLGGSGGAGLGESLVVTRAFLGNPETAKAKACGPDDLDCINSLGLEEGDEEIHGLETASIQ